MLIDRCVIEVRSGKGGDGCISFLRDKNTAKGGPDGGNGGRGGSIYFLGKANLNNLYNFRHSRTFIAQDGEKGMKTMKGKRSLSPEADAEEEAMPASNLPVTESHASPKTDTQAKRRDSSLNSSFWPMPV